MQNYFDLFICFAVTRLGAALSTFPEVIFQRIFPSLDNFYTFKVEDALRPNFVGISELLILSA